MQRCLHCLELLYPVHFRDTGIHEISNLAYVCERRLYGVVVAVRGRGVVQEVLEEERVLVQALHGQDQHVLKRRVTNRRSSGELLGECHTRHSETEKQATEHDS